MKHSHINVTRKEKIMFGMVLFVIGLFIIIGAATWCVLPKLQYHGNTYQTDDDGKTVTNKKGNKVKVKVGLGYVPTTVLVLLGLFIAFFVQGAFYYAEPGKSYLVQYPNGTQVGETTPGYHMKYWGSYEPFDKFIPVKADKEDNPNISADIDTIEGRFTDSVTADVSVTALFQLPTVEKDFLNMAVAFRTQENLENTTLIPVLREVVRNSARTMTAQDYIAGKGGEFENAILDQLREGIYLLDITEIRPEGKVDVTNVDEDRGIEQSQMVRYEVSKTRGPDGQILRKPTALLDYKIIVSQANISGVDPEPKFKEMLALQRDAAAQASVKKQEAKRAEYDKQKIIAEGEASKAQIQVDQEKLQITKLISAETMLKEAKIDLAQAKIQREKEVELAAKVKIAADAQAYAKRKVIEADGALTQKLEAFNQAVEDIAKGWANRKVPQTVIMSGGGNGNGSGNGAEYNGSPQEVQIMLGMMLADMAKKNLNVDLQVK